MYHKANKQTHMLFQEKQTETRSHVQMVTLLKA
jgi:hypothetical protein